MKYKMILLLYGVIAPCTVILRLVQLLAFNNPFRQDQSGDDLLNFILWLVIFIAILAIGFFGSTAFRLPKKTPKVGWALCGVSVFYAVSCAFTALYADRIYIGNGIPAFLLLALRVFGFITAAVFLLYAVSGMLSLKLPDFLFIAPIVFSMFRLICYFISQNDKKQSMDHFLIILMDCLYLLFFTELGKQFNNIDKDYTFRKLLSTGLASSALGFCYSVPCLLAAVFSPAKIDGINLRNTFYVFFTAIFVLVFCLMHFGDSNLGIHHHRHHHHEKRTPGDDKGTLYTGG